MFFLKNPQHTRTDSKCLYYGMPCLISVNLAAINTSNRDDCDLSIDGKTSKYLMLTKTSKTHKINVVGQGSCRLKLFAVGGGGKRTSHYAGAGSGFLLYGTIPVNFGDQITATVGQERYSSTVSISGKSYTAASGQDATTVNGGDGYSGGGGYGMYNGGANGSKGEGATGGSGTGGDISNLKFKYWDLSPGDGGKHDSNSGGGGGGVLVNGEGPTRKEHHEGQGNGYGAGGSGCSCNPHGLPGVILMEVDM